MATQTVTYTDFENVPSRPNRLHMTTMQAFNGTPYIIATLNGSQGLEWAFEGYDANNTMIVDIGWLPNGYNLDLSQTYRIDEVTQWEIWLRFSENYDISPADITSVVCQLEVEEGSGWYVGRDGITNEEFLDDVPFMAKPYPLSIWQCDELVDNGFAHVPLFPDAVKIDPQPVRQSPYIVVYDIRATQAELSVPNNNGLAILTPSMCEETEELCGMWSVQMEHPCDPENRWKLIQEGNILRVNGQLFTIKKTEQYWDGASGKVTAYAEHIWYQYGDNWIFADPINVISYASKDTQSAIDDINTLLTEKTYISGGVQYAFHGYGKADGFVKGSLFYVSLDSGCTPIDLILGENGIIPQMGGELHRDNFYFSIYERKETAKDDAFDIRVGKNLMGVRVTVDTTTLCTYYRLTDASTGMWNNIGWDTASYASSVWRNFLPHHVVRSEIVDIPSETRDRFGQLCNIMEARFHENCMPIIGYEFSVEDVRRNPDFSMSSEESIRVGDIGKVYDERIGGELMLEVTSTVYDRIKNKCTSFTVGNKQSFVYHGGMAYIRDANGNIINPSQLGYELWVQDSTGRYLYDSTGRKIIIMKEDDD